jgi:membrane-associated phospholipid phosphatase
MQQEGRSGEGSLVGKRCVAIWIALALAGSLLALTARGAGPMAGDLLLMRSLQRLGPETLAGSSLVRFGEAAWWLLPLVVVLIALLKRRWLEALFLSIAALTGALVGDLLLKDLVGRPRPAAEMVRAAGSAEGYSFPSGTVFLVTVTLGAACYLIWRARPPRSAVAGAFGVALFLVLLVGVSRVYSGEHWPTDVLGGWLLGGVWTILLVAVHRWWDSSSRRLREEEGQRGDKVDADEHRAL